MKALTIWQPWATLIMAGAKPYEWRSWPAPRWIVGQRIVIHAGARPMRQVELREILDDLATGDTSMLAAKAWDVVERAHLGLPLASGLGTVIIGQPRPATEIYPDDDLASPDMWGWPLSDIQHFEPIIPMRGAQGFWSWPERSAA